VGGISRLQSRENEIAIFLSLCAIKEKPRNFCAEFEIQFLLPSARMKNAERKEGKFFDFIEQKHYFLLDKIARGAAPSLYIQHYTTCAEITKEAA